MCGLIPAVLMPLKAEERGASKQSGGKGTAGPQNEEQERIILIQVMK